MPPFGARDLGTLVKDMGVLVVFAGQSAKGLLDSGLDLKLGGGGFAGTTVEEKQLRLPYNAFARMPVSGDQLTADGTPYTVTTPTAEDDGAFLCYALNEID